MKNRKKGIYENNGMAELFTKKAMELVRKDASKRINAIWLEATGCSGNIISFIDSLNPGILSIFTRLINLKFNNTLMGLQGDRAYEQFLETLSSDFVLLVDGAVSTKDDGFYNIIANYNGRPITALEAVKTAGEKAKYIIAVGTCASYGGISAARPNPSQCKSVKEVLNRDVIRLPGCPSHPDWVVGTLAHLINFGMPELDAEGRPTMFYGVTIHDNCTRRSYFDRQIYAKSLGDKECMFKLGCRGPVTKTDCPTRKWNGYINWPVGDNTPCIGCAQKYFPDGMEPFIR